ncbi:MAG: creatininase family protein [Pseudomonadota bacterium]
MADPSHHPGRTEGHGAHVLWAGLTAKVLCAAAEGDVPVLFPVASTEQHGPHLATGVDSVLCSHVCHTAALSLYDQGIETLVLPTLWAGMAEHHMAFGGTLTVSLATYQAVIGEVCGSVLRHGFKRILIVNGHGGNIAPLAAMAPDLARILGVAVPVTTYFDLVEEPFAGVLEDQTSVLHAGEAETSMMMVAAPHLVDETAFGEAHGGDAFLAARASGVGGYKSFKDFTPSGVIGNARRASTKKGEQLVALAAAALADLVASGTPWR